MRTGGDKDERAWAALKDALDDDCDDGELCTLHTPPHLVFDRPRDDVAGFERLRTTHDTLTAGIATYGLAGLQASGSSQFTSPGLRSIVHALTARRLVDVPAQVTVFDLRYEPHGEADDFAVSWHVWNNHLNCDTPVEYAQADEARRLANLATVGGDATAYRICKQRVGRSKQVFYHPEPSTFAATATEEQTVQAQGLHYARLPMADHTGAPTDAVVERFIAAIRARPEGSWWHFHCRKGKGRTSLFMAMLDMAYNAPRLPLESITARQAALSGVDILHVSAHEPHKSDVRRRFARAFYAYTAAGMPGRWSDWPRAAEYSHE